MQKRMSRPIRRSTTPIRLPTLPKLQRLAPQRPLINPALVRPTKWHPVSLQLVHRGGRLARHVVDGVLVAEPVGPLDRVVHVPAPVVFAHVAEGGVDAALGGHGVRARGEEFGYAGGVEAAGGETECGAEAGAAGSDDDGAGGWVSLGGGGEVGEGLLVVVVDYGVVEGWSC